MKKVIWLSFFVLFFLIPIKTQAAKANFLIINQVRGNESCCHAGNLKLITEINQEKSLNSLPINWALRFDALLDDKIAENLSKSGEIGLLLEITPQLASASGVKYKGDPSGKDWYLAKNSFLIGYTQDERKKIIDTLFEQYYKNYHSYPSFTVSWMIDAWSLRYIYEKYHIVLHELTKEQYETDSYTLYGGIFNAPYYPSLNHPLIPADEEKLDLLIVRQTISDVIKNYGSSKAYYTSQPNDYRQSKEHLDFNYFQGLVDNALKQTNPNNLNIIGIENSPDFDKYIPEYFKQLNLIGSLKDKGKIALQKPSQYFANYKKIFPSNPAFYIQNISDDKKNGVIWYFGKTYRARIILKNSELILDDLRTFEFIEDPYKESPSISDYSYWIVPFLLDGSQMYTVSNDQKKYLKKIGLLNDLVLPDYVVDPYGISFGKGNFSLYENGQELDIYYEGNKKGIHLTPDKIIFDKKINPYLVTSKRIKMEELFQKDETTISHNKLPDLAFKLENNSLLMGWEFQNIFTPLFKLDTINESYELSVVSIKNLEHLNIIFQPERAALPLNKSKTVIYWNNKDAIAGRNPIRIFLLPLNILSRPTKIRRIEVTSNNTSNLNITYPQDYSYKITPWFVDISSEAIGSSFISIKADEVTLAENVTIVFHANCSKRFQYCLNHPGELVYFIKTIISEQVSKLKPES